MTDLWSDLADSRAAARTAERKHETVLASLAAVRDQLGLLTSELAALPGRIAAATPRRDQAVAAATAAATALGQAQAAAAAAGSTLTAAEQALAVKQAALDDAQGRIDDLNAQLEDVLATDPIGPNGKPVPGRSAAIARLTKQLATQQQAVEAGRADAAAAARAVEAARPAAQATARAAAQAATVAAQAAQARGAAQAEVDRLQALLDRARADRPALETQAAALETQAAAAATDAAAGWKRFDGLLDAWLAQATAARRAVRKASDAAVTARLAGAGSAADAAAARARADLDAVRRRALGGPERADVVAAVRTDVPLALLPVRLETAFLDAAGGVELAVRMYPDTASVDGNVAQLSKQERDLGTAAMSEIASGDAARGRVAFDRLAAAVGDGRATWILRALRVTDRGARPDGWRPPPALRLLPDRFVVLGYAGGKRIVAQWGELIPPDLPVLDGAGGPDGLAPAQRGWATDLAAAVATGMAVRIPLTGEQIESLDAVVALGVNASGTPDALAAELAELLHVHRCLGGLALPPLGAATNVQGSRRGGVLTAARGRPSAALELGRQAGAGTDGDRLARALGLPAADPPLARVPGAAATGQLQAGHANALLWPLTWGYFFEHLQPGVLGDKTLGELRAHAVDHVRGRGPLPLLQIADQPYGVLPVTSLTRIAPGDALEGALADLLRSLRDRVWLPAVAQVPRLDPEATAQPGALTAVLSQRGRSLGLRSRALLGGEYAWNLWNFLADGPVAPAAWQEQTARAQGLATVLGVPAGRVADGAFAAAAAPVALPPAGDAKAEIAFLLARGWRELRDGPAPASVLALLLRHAALRSYADAAATLLGVAPEQRADAELIAVTAPQDTVWDRLQRPLADGRKVGDVLDARRKAPGSGPAAFDGFWAALAALAKLDNDAWEDLLAETLDTSSHRLDAWVTSLAARRLARMRAARGGGLAVGAYGWVTDLRPSEARRLAAEERRALAARDAAAAALEAARPRSVAAVAARAARDAELTGAQATLSAATSRVEQLQQQIAALEEQLAELDPMEPGPKPKPNPAALTLRRAIARANAALETALGDVTSATAAVATATAAAAAARREETAATAAESAAAQALDAAEDELAALRVRLGLAQAGTEEFVHAPSLQHASTAAVLRSAHLAHAGAVAGPGAAEAPFAVDLSSARLRRALHVLEGVRAGQPPAALLGYQLERDLRERKLSHLVLPLRTLSPYGELTAAEVRAVELHRAADAAAATLQTLNDDRVAAEVTAAAAADALHTADLAIVAARADDAAARAALADARGAHTAARLALEELQRTAGERRRHANIPPWKRPDDSFPPEVQEAEQAVEDQLAAVAELGATLATAQRRAADAAARLSSAQTASDNARAAVAAAGTALADLQKQIDALSAEAARLHDEAVAADAEVERLRTTLRDQAVEATAASSVIDGLALLQRYRAGRDRGVWDATTLPLGAPGSELPAPASAAGAALMTALARLAETVDAVADAATAESVHQLVQGNLVRASAAADALPHFDLPPELDVARTPRNGSAFTQRLAVLTPVALAPAGADGWPAVPSPRAAAEPMLERWLRARLPDPRRVRARIEWDGAPATERTLASLGLAALDVVHGTSGDHGEVTERLLYAAAQDRPAGAQGVPRLVAGRAASWAADVTSWSELLVVAGALRELLAAARPCDARDLAPPADGTDPGIELPELTARADAATRALAAARAAVESGGAAALLAAAAFGVPGAVPVPGGTASAQVPAVAAELARRHEAVLAAEAAFAATQPTAADALAHQLRRLKLVFGDGFLALPRVRAGVPAALPGVAPAAVWAWLHRAARVRADAGRLCAALTLTEAVGVRGAPALDVVQLPGGGRWLALPDARPAGGEVSLVIAHDAPLAPNAAVAGFVVDEWSETVPDAQVHTGVALRLPRPRAQAPQSILLAVPPTEQHVWDLDTLEAVVLETLQLTRVRAVDLEALDAAGSAVRQYLPAAYLAANAAGATVASAVPVLT